MGPRGLGLYQGLEALQARRIEATVASFLDLRHHLLVFPL
jgi:hypothetical protein